MDVDDQLRRAANQLDPDRPVEAAAEETLLKLDRLQEELDRLLAGLRTTQASLTETLERLDRP